MNGSYHLNRFYAQERIDARLNEAESHRLARRTREENKVGFVIGAAAARASNWIGRAASQVAQILEALGEARVAAQRR